MVNRNIEAEQNVFGISIGWRGAGNPERRGGGGSDDHQGKSDAEIEADDRKDDKHKRTLLEHGKELLEHTKKTVRQSLGINVGVASLLKQSQLFTGTLGTIFQILGAMVDVVLAAFMPLIIPALKKMANSIPQIQEKAERIRIGIEHAVAWLREMAGTIKNHPVVKWLTSSLGTLLQYWLIGVFIAKITGLWTPFWALHRYFGGQSIRLLGVIAKEIGMMRLASQVSAMDSSSGMAPGLLSIQKGTGRFGTSGVGATPMMGKALAGGGVLAGLGLGYASGGAAGMGGAGVGALAGGVIGSFLPGIGTLLGTTAGSIIGGMLVGFFNQRDSENDSNRRHIYQDMYRQGSKLDNSNHITSNDPVPRSLPILASGN